MEKIIEEKNNSDPEKAAEENDKDPHIEATEALNPKEDNNNSEDLELSEEDEAAAIEFWFRNVMYILYFVLILPFGAVGSECIYWIEGMVTLLGLTTLILFRTIITQKFCVPRGPGSEREDSSVMFKLKTFCSWSLAFFATVSYILYQIVVLLFYRRLDWMFPEEEEEEEVGAEGGYNNIAGCALPWTNRTDFEWHVTNHPKNCWMPCIPFYIFPILLALGDLISYTGAFKIVITFFLAFLRKTRELADSLFVKYPSATVNTGIGFSFTVSAGFGIITFYWGHLLRSANDGNESSPFHILLMIMGCYYIVLALDSVSLLPGKRWEEENYARITAFLFLLTIILAGCLLECFIWGVFLNQFLYPTSGQNYTASVDFIHPILLFKGEENETLLQFGKDAAFWGILSAITFDVAKNFGVGHYFVLRRLENKPMSWRKLIIFSLLLPHIALLPVSLGLVVLTFIYWALFHMCCKSLTERRHEDTRMADPVFRWGVGKRMLVKMANPEYARKTCTNTWKRKTEATELTE